MGEDKNCLSVRRKSSILPARSSACFELIISDLSLSHEIEIEEIEGYTSLLAQELMHTITAQSAPAYNCFIILIECYNEKIMNRTKFLKIAVLCILSAIGNVLGSYLRIKTGIPLYIDTIFNAAICFSAGLLPGVITGMLLFPVMNYWVNMFFRGPSLGFFGNIWEICILVEIILVWFFYKKMKEREAVFFEDSALHTFIGVAAQLLVLAVLDCIVISVTGGIIDYVLSSLSMPRTFSPEDNFKLGLLRNNVPLLATAILARIPINMVDRFIVIFGGYGISLLYRKWLVPGRN